MAENDSSVDNTKAVADDKAAENSADDKSLISEAKDTEDSDKNKSLISEAESSEDSKDKAEDSKNKAEGEEEDSKAAPEEYEEFKVPEGLDLDKELLEEFAPIAKELGLDQDNAQKFVDFGSRIAQKVQEKNNELWSEMRENWVKETKGDKEVGGNNLNESAKLGKLAIKQVGSDELMSLLDTSGLGDNVHMIKFLKKVGEMISEDKLHTGRSLGQSGDTDPAKRMYPTMNT